MRFNSFSAAEAVKVIKSGDRVFVHGGAATPIALLNALFRKADQLNNVELVSLSTLGNDVFDPSKFPGSFFLNSLFVSDNVRGIANSDGGDYIPIFLSEIPRLFESGNFPIDVALIHVSVPDKHGFCSLGTSVDITRSAVRHAKYVIAQVNKYMPRTLGDGMIHVRDIHQLVYVDAELPEVSYKEQITDAAITIGHHCAGLIEDRSTLQMGIGSIPDAVLSCLFNHKDLGIHTEMFSDGVIPLMEAGVITIRFKKKHRG